MPNARWNVREPAPAEFLRAFPNLPPLATQLLYNRDLHDPAEAEEFLNAGDALTWDASTLPDMDRAVARLYQALLSGEKIAIYGDFDTDGVTATALLVQAFEELGGQVVPYIPHRTEDGHGLNVKALRDLLDQGCTVVITADCGITGVQDGEMPSGFDLIVTDHHLPSSDDLPYFAAVNPHLANSSYPFKELTGVGIAFKLVQALFATIGRPWQKSHLELVALGTIADVGELRGENRFLVRNGLDVLRETQRPGLRALADVAHVSLDTADAEDIGFALSPRLNAAGRMAHADTSFRLLTTSSPEEALSLAMELESLNLRRRELTRTLVDEAHAQIDAGVGIGPLLMVGGEDFLPGIAGLVAGRLAEEFYRPAFVYHRGEEFTQGSARSIKEFNVTEALDACADLLVRYGGHHQAAGFRTRTEDLPALHDRLTKFAQQELGALDLQPSLDIDAETSPSALPGKVAVFLSRLEPFGEGNPMPTFLSRGLQVVQSRRIGDGSHLRFQLRDERTVWEAVAFNQGHRLEQIGDTLDVVYNLRVNRWRRRSKLELNIVDLQA